MRVQELDPVVALAHEAGNAILAIYNRSDRNAVVDWKADRTPLTEGDRASHEVILAGLRALDPRTPIVSEEGDPPVGSSLGSGAPHWMVDPLDGTKEFLKGTGEFTVNIALIGDGRPLAGVVHAPVLGRTWIGGVDGAERREGNRRERLCVRRIRPDRLGVVASRDHAGPRVRELLERLPGAETVSMGSSLKFCVIAEGNADLYLRDGPTMEWDTAAAQAVLEAAGGGVFTLEGQRLSYGKLDFLNPHFLALGDLGWDWKQAIRGRPGL
jgi:3'(2'), 5'-bisphosphate nucleotidase